MQIGNNVVSFCSLSIAVEC